MKYIILILLFLFPRLAMAQNFDHTSCQYLENNGARIYYEVKGNMHLPVLLLLHGGYGNMEDFNVILPELEKNYTVIGIDSRGHGKSTLGTHGLSYELLQKDAEAVLQHLNVDSLTILGFSDGGIVAYRLAAFTSLKIKKMITIGARWNIKNTGPKKAEWLKMTGDGIKAKWPDDYKAYASRNPEPDFNAFTTSIVKMWLDNTTAGYPNEKVENIRCPVLIVRGDNDPYITIQDVADLSRLIQHSTVLNIPFAGHYAFRDQKEIFLTCLNQFLKRE